MEKSSAETPGMDKVDTPVINVDEDSVNEPVNSVDQQDVEEENNNKGSRNRSFVWDHFKIDEVTKKAKCPYCKSLLACGTKKNSTSALQYHLKKVCKKSPLYNPVDKTQSTLSFKPKISGEGGGSLASHSFSQEKCRQFLARMCIKDNRPFSVVDDEGFREFVWELNPMFKFPSRWTVARDCLLIYEEERKKLKNLLRDQTVSLTTDTWTSVQNFNYMCLTAHWIDKNWAVRKRILNFGQISNHKGETIGKLVYRCLQEWGIDRVFTITVDNASSNDGTEKRDEKFEVLVWWNANSIKFPILSQIAKHVLGMPISTVASESAFSTGGRVIDKYRSSLTPKTAEALICTQDWLRSTPTDLQDSCIHGQQLEALVEALEKMEIDVITGKKTPKDSTIEDVEDDEHEDWD